MTEIDEWKKRSERGDVCGILGCDGKPKIHCNRCGNWYCEEHSLVHFHVVEEGTDDTVAGNEKDTDKNTDENAKGQVPENPYRKALAGVYIDKYLGKPDGDVIQKAVNGNGGERSLDYYIGAERMINNAIQVFMTIDEKELHGAGGAFSAMLSYVSYEIERLSAFQNKN